ncbi:uncharacterized protein LY79DRAFT_24708 [Colletotrichum navitas]|uniref:Secreted protein n=1 Tax=Colletotrichum navitas TaxID=681940 RepID=A0AAD8QEB6_9PEZI|nr:uncharacterized protein LY79DRAFT_24708 [Colletotrichum navitas]KAK1600579.1 hypothetical protein LY79DRAFT_24708 [Colletotrichum navitas]
MRLVCVCVCVLSVLRVYETKRNLETFGWVERRDKRAPSTLRIHVAASNRQAWQSCWQPGRRYSGTLTQRQPPVPYHVPSLGTLRTSAADSGRARALRGPDATSSFLLRGPSKDHCVRHCAIDESAT